MAQKLDVIPFARGDAASFPQVPLRNRLFFSTCGGWATPVKKFHTKLWPQAAFRSRLSQHFQRCSAISWGLFCCGRVNLRGVNCANDRKPNSTLEQSAMATMSYHTPTGSRFQNAACV